MRYDKSEVRNRSPLVEKGGRTQLEKLLGGVTLDTDVMDFLTIAGLDYAEGPLWDGADRQLRETLYENYKMRKAKLSLSVKMREGRFRRRLWRAYSERRVKTLRDLKETIEQKGLFVGMGYLGLSEFNKTLAQYGIEPYKVGGKYESARVLRKYGLEPSGR